MATSKQVFAALLAYDAFIERCDGDPNTGARLEAMRLALDAAAGVNERECEICNLPERHAIHCPTRGTHLFKPVSKDIS